MSIVRKTLAALSAAAMIASSAASATSIRPSDSLVSASSVSPVAAINGRRNAVLDETNQARSARWILVFLVIGTIVVAIWIAVDSDDEPESP